MALCLELGPFNKLSPTAQASSIWTTLNTSPTFGIGTACLNTYLWVARALLAAQHVDRPTRGCLHTSPMAPTFYIAEKLYVQRHSCLNVYM